MSDRRKKIWGLVIAGIGAVAAISLPFHAARAVTTFDDGDLNGRYFFNLVEIRNDGPGLDFCDSAGMFDFFGDGTAFGSSTRRCSVSGPASSSGPFTYNVMPDGEFFLTEVGTTGSTHGQILQKGELLLFDSTTGTDPAVLVQNGTMAPRR